MKEEEMKDVYIMKAQRYVGSFYQMLTIFTLINLGAIIALLIVLTAASSSGLVMSAYALKFSLVLFFVALGLLASFFYLDFVEIFKQHQKLRECFYSSQKKNFLKIIKEDKSAHLKISKRILIGAVGSSLFGGLVALIVIIAA